jgi:hypothetical protein
LFLIVPSASSDDEILKVAATPHMTMGTEVTPELAAKVRAIKSRRWLFRDGTEMRRRGGGEGDDSAFGRSWDRSALSPCAVTSDAMRRRVGDLSGFTATCLVP